MNISSPTTAPLDEAAARRVLMVRAFETCSVVSPSWSLDDRAWATQLARETVAAGALPQRFIAERASHALQRLSPREPAIALLLQPPPSRHSGWLMAALLGLLAGLVVDAIGSAQRINLLAPPLGAVLVWNLAVYAGLLLMVFTRPRAPRGLAALLMRWTADRPGGGNSAARRPPLQAFTAAWANLAAPLARARVASLLHLAAAALGLGLVAGLYVRGLVLDYRAGWESTFLDATAVHALLGFLLAPAVAVSGLPLPDVAAVQSLRLGPQAAATAPAAAWIHLFATLLMMGVVLPRLGLAGWAAWRAQRNARALPLPLGEPYYQRLWRQGQGAAARVQWLAHGAAPSAQALRGVHDWLARALGPGVQWAAGDAAAAVVGYGDEDGASPLPPPQGTTLRLALVDLASTPEDDSHGRWLRALGAGAPGMPLLLLADEHSFRRRFAANPARLVERRAAWQKLAAAHGVAWVGVDLSQPDLANADAVLEAAWAVAANGLAR